MNHQILRIALILPPPPLRDGILVGSSSYLAIALGEGFTLVEGVAVAAACEEIEIATADRSCHCLE